MARVLKGICFIRSIKFVHVDINFIRTVQVIIRKNGPFTLVKRKVDIWGRELDSPRMRTDKVQRIRRF